MAISSLERTSRHPAPPRLELGLKAPAMSTLPLAGIPTQAFPQAAAHDPVEVVGGKEIQLLGEVGDTLPIATMLQGARQVGAPEAAPRTEGLDHAAQRFVQVGERI